MDSRTIVVFGPFAPLIDGSTSEHRGRWHPILSLCQFADFPIHRFHFFYNEDTAHLAVPVMHEMQLARPEMEIVTTTSQTPSRFRELYAVFYAFFQAYSFDLRKEQYFFYIPPGSMPELMMVIVTLINSRSLPCQLMHVFPPQQEGESASYKTIDLDIDLALSVKAQVETEHENVQHFLKSGIATRNEPFNLLIEELEHVTLNSRAPLLLSGPTGAGKSQLVRRLYELRLQRGLLAGALIEVNCATLRGESALSTLFGHSKGAFTGALERRQGLLRAANNGVLFLDEIGELDLNHQALLLKALEEKKFFPLGSDQEVSSDFQLICGTNRDLYEEARQGRFRLDLLARVNLWHFTLPALKDRPEDIEPNLSYELDRLRKTMPALRISARARESFLQFATSPEALWTGNFRDLSGAVERMATFASGNIITSDIVKRELQRLRTAWELFTPLESQSSRSLPTVMPSVLAPTPTLSEAQHPFLSDDDMRILQHFLGTDCLHEHDLFDCFHLAGLIRVCRASRSRAEAGRTLFALSRLKKQHQDDTSRLSKYLQHYGLDWEKLGAMGEQITRRGSKSRI